MSCMQFRMPEVLKGLHDLAVPQVSDLQYASPATVSRCGMVYVDQRDLGSAPYYDCWARSKSNSSLLEIFDYLWDKYVPQCLAFIMQDKARDDEASLPAQCIHRTDVSMVCLTADYA